MSVCFFFFTIYKITDYKQEMYSTDLKMVIVSEVVI